MKTITSLLLSFLLLFIFSSKSVISQDVVESEVENFRTVTKDHCEWKYSCCDRSEPLLDRCQELCFRSWNCEEHPETTDEPQSAQFSTFGMFSSQRGGFYGRVRPARIVCPEGYKSDHRNRCRKVFDFE